MNQVKAHMMAMDQLRVGQSATQLLSANLHYCDRTENAASSALFFVNEVSDGVYESGGGLKLRHVGTTSHYRQFRIVKPRTEFPRHGRRRGLVLFAHKNQCRHCDGAKL